MLPLMCVCVRAQPSFLQHYVQIASRKLLLFHGRRNLGVKGHRLRQQQLQIEGAPNSSSSCCCELVIRLSDLVNSPVMAELQELLTMGPGAEMERDLYSNWFSLQVGTGRRMRLARAGMSLFGSDGPCLAISGSWIGSQDS